MKIYRHIENDIAVSELVQIANIVETKTAKRLYRAFNNIFSNNGKVDGVYNLDYQMARRDMLNVEVYWANIHNCRQVQISGSNQEGDVQTSHLIMRPIDSPVYIQDLYSLGDGRRSILEVEDLLSIMWSARNSTDTEQ